MVPDEFISRHVQARSSDDPRCVRRTKSIHHIAPWGRRERSIRSKMRRQARVRIFTDKNSLDHFRHGQIDFAARPERDDFFFQSSSVSSTRTRVLLSGASKWTQIGNNWICGGQARGQAFSGIMLRSYCVMKCGACICALSPCGRGQFGVSTKQVWVRGSLV
jgi:hypothetical protein